MTEAASEHDKTDKWFSTDAERRVAEVVLGDRRHGLQSQIEKEKSYVRKLN
jgi:hypothetical protein